MKKIVKLSLIVMCVVSFTNCNKEESQKEEVQKSATLEETKEYDFDVTIKNAEEYVLDLNISGDEEGASIITQAENMEYSKIERGPETGWNVIYYYKPQAGFVGTDFVEIETCTGTAVSDGITTCDDINVITIKLTVTD